MSLHVSMAPISCAEAPRKCYGLTGTEEVISGTYCMRGRIMFIQFEKAYSPEFPLFLKSEKEWLLRRCSTCSSHLVFYASHTCLRLPEGFLHQLCQLAVSEQCFLISHFIVKVSYQVYAVTSQRSCKLNLNIHIWGLMQ